MYTWPQLIKLAQLCKAKIMQYLEIRKYDRHTQPSFQYFHIDGRQISELNTQTSTNIIKEKDELGTPSPHNK